jgi:hypothetical protein
VQVNISVGQNRKYSPRADDFCFGPDARTLRNAAGMPVWCDKETHATQQTASLFDYLESKARRTGTGRSTTVPEQSSVQLLTSAFDASPSFEDCAIKDASLSIAIGAIATSIPACELRAHLPNRGGLTDFSSTGFCRFCLLLTRTVNISLNVESERNK